MLRKTALTVAVIFMLSFVSGCANIKDDGSRTRAEGAGTGAAIGAVGGAIFGQLLGGDTTSTLLGAAIGGAVGGAGGYAYGDHVASEKERYANQEDWLNASIAEARKKNSELRVYDKELKQQIAQLQKETKALKTKHSKQASVKQAMIAKKNKVDALLKEAKTQLASAREEMDAQDSVKADIDKSKGSDFTESLDSEIATLKVHIKNLQQQTEALASMSVSMAV